MASPALVHERWLVDHRRACANCLLCGLGGRKQALVAGGRLNLNERVAVSLAQQFEMALLVLLTLLCQDLHCVWSLRR